MTRVNLRATARRQHGVVTRAQALAAGMTSKQVRWRLQRGDWRRLHRGVYLTNTGRVTWPVRAWAALLWSGEGSLLVEEAAAYVWRLQRAEPAVITVGVPHGRYPPRVVGVRTLQRRRRRRRTVDGFPVSHLAQTVVDLADRPGVSLDDVVSLAARACQQRLVDADSLLTELDARGRHRHRRGLRLALGEIADGAESLPEVWFARRVLRRHGLPAFERQVVQRDGTRADLRSREYGVNVEVDGQVWHAGSGSTRTVGGTGPRPLGGR